LPALFAASIALGGSRIWGKEYIAPATTQSIARESSKVSNNHTLIAVNQQSLEF
jgi:hypothetical protein